MEPSGPERGIPLVDLDDTTDPGPAPRAFRWWWLPAVLAAFLFGWVAADRVSELTGRADRRAEPIEAAAADPTADESGIEVAPVTTPAPAAATQDYDRRYRTRDGVTIGYDVRWPNGLPARPAVVLLHGGGWWSGDKQDALVTAVSITLQRAGFVVVSGNYRLTCGSEDAPRSFMDNDFTSTSPLCGATIPVQVSDVVDLLGHVREHATELRIDQRRIALMGMSAGGHLALLAATEPGGGVRAVVNWSGPPDVEFIRRQPTRAKDKASRTIRPSFTNAVGCDLAICPERWTRASPLAAIIRTRFRAPILSVAGEHESQVPFEELVKFHRRLDALRVRNALFAGAGQCHGAGCATMLLTSGTTTALDSTIAFLQRATRPLRVPAAPSAPARRR